LEAEAFCDFGQALLLEQGMAIRDSINDREA